jgi:hypothetical protein
MQNEKIFASFTSDVTFLARLYREFKNKPCKEATNH